MSEQAAPLTEVFESLGHLLATNSRDWGAQWDDAWLWAVLCGWDCEQTEHDDTCTHGAMEEMATKFGWDAETVAKLRRYRAAVRAASTGPVRPGEEPGADDDHDFRLGDDRVQRCTRCKLPHSQWAGGPCPGPAHPFKPGEYV